MTGEPRVGVVGPGTGMAARVINNAVAHAEMDASIATLWED